MAQMSHPVSRMTQNNEIPVISSTKKINKNNRLAIKLDGKIFPGHEIMYS